MRAYENPELHKTVKHKEMSFLQLVQCDVRLTPLRFDIPTYGVKHQKKHYVKEGFETALEAGSIW